MREIVKRFNVYRFEELPEDAQTKALEKNWTINVDHDWWDDVYYDAENIGLKITGFDIDRGNYCSIKPIKDCVDIAKKILTDHGKVCDTYKSAQKFLDAYNALLDQDRKGEIDEFDFSTKYEELEEEFLNDLAGDYLSILRQEYDYLISEEALKETFELNEYEFTEDGEIYYS